MFAYLHPTRQSLTHVAAHPSLVPPNNPGTAGDCVGVVTVQGEVGAEFYAARWIEDTGPPRLHSS